MSKQRFMKIMSWYLIISMVLQMLPINLIAVAMAESGSTPVPTETVVSDAAETEPGEAQSENNQGLIYRTVSFGDYADEVMVADGNGLGEVGRAGAQ